jgi:hypothetical protein
MDEEIRKGRMLEAVEIDAIHSVVEDLRPSWVGEVKEAARISNRPRWIADWCELSEQVVVAILMNLEARGELPDS